MDLYSDGFVLMGPTAGDPFTQNYTPNEPLSGVLWLGYSLTTTVRDFGVTYAGAPLTQVPLSPFTLDIGADEAVLYAFFLGNGLPTDTTQREIVVDFNDGSGAFVQGLLFGIVHSTGDPDFIPLQGDLQVVDTSTFTGTTANPSITLGAGGAYFLPFGLNVSGVDAVGSIAPGADTFQDQEVDRGTQVAAWYSYGGPAPGAVGTWTLNWTAASDTAGILGVAVGPDESDSQADGLNATLTDHFQWKHRPYIKIGSVHGPLSRTA